MGAKTLALLLLLLLLTRSFTNSVLITKISTQFRSPRTQVKGGRRKGIGMRRGGVGSKEVREGSEVKEWEWTGVRGQGQG